MSALFDIVVWFTAAVLFGVFLFIARRRTLDTLDERHPLRLPVGDEPLPQYPPAFEPEPEVIVGQIVVEDELGEWCPDEHQPEPARFAEAVLAELTWQTIAAPPTWASWSTTGYRQLAAAQ